MPDTCYGPECSRTAVKTGLCDTHYQQKTKRADGRLTVIGSVWVTAPAASLTRDSEGRKECVEGHWCSEAAFYRDKNTPDGFERRCKTCRRVKYVLRIYGISLELFDRLLDQQKGLCAGCGAEPKGADYCVDHDHACCPGSKVQCGGECVRGLLCRNCNLALGNARDSATTLRNLANYVDNGGTRVGLAG